jgi:hypothetical protein
MLADAGKKQKSTQCSITENMAAAPVNGKLSIF